MIAKLQGHLTQNTIDTIVNMIKIQYREYLLFTNTERFVSVFSNEYAPHKRQHSVSWAISSAFPSGSKIDDTLNVECLTYGKGHKRPMLRNKDIIIHILNKTTHFDAKYLKEFYLNNVNNFMGEVLYCYFKFSVSHNRLMQVSLCLPDENGIVVNEEVLLDEQSILRFVA